MSEKSRSAYQALFDVRLLHHYWLDDGATLFDRITDETQKNQRLLAYDRRRFLSVVPTGPTVEKLQGLDCVYQDTALGFIVAMPDDRTIAADTVFEFAVSVANNQFSNYTAFTLPAQEIVELYHEPELRYYRYKSKVFLLSNSTGASRGSGAGKTLYLSGNYSVPGAEDRIESLVLTGGALSQLTSDPPNPDLNQLDADADAMPVFVHQDDVPAITPPAGLSGAPERGILLSDGMPNDLFALIRLNAITEGDPDFSFIDSDGGAKLNYPVFHIRFKNRSTIRQYLNQRTGSITFTEPAVLPMTYFGNAGNRKKPSIDRVKAEKSGAKIVRLVSEIFV
ncbi:hypothetical protein [Methylomonas sp. MgM2]